MPVGFRVLPSFEAAAFPFLHDVPDAPWALQFSRFEGVEPGEQGALTFSEINGVAGLGDGITIAHTDTGYTPHPELMHGNTVRTSDARTFTVPAPSYQTYGPGVRQFWNNTSHGASAAVRASFSTRNGVQVQAGASAWYAFDDGGIDTLDDSFVTLNASHGTSTASLFMSPTGAPSASDFPDYASDAQQVMGKPPTPINGAAPAARLLPIRVTDTVIVDPIVANNLAMGIMHATNESLTDPSIGVISISLGWPGGGAFQNYTALSRALELATRAGLIVCAAAAQTKAPLHMLFEGWANTADAITGGADTVAEAAIDVQRLAAITQAVALLTGLSLGQYQTVQDLCDDVTAKAQAASVDARKIEDYMRYIQSLTLAEARAARIIGGPGYPGTDPNTICCAACDFRGDELFDGLYGPEVDITAPGVEMFSAKSAKNDAGGVDYYTHQSQGTSYSTAITAGAAALWLAHHDRQALIAQYGAGFMLHLFRWALTQSAATQTQTPGSTQAPWDRARRGYGMLDAKALLSFQLPDDTATLINEMHSAEMISDSVRAQLRLRAGL